MSKPLILMYHRIADEPVDYWGLAVSPEHFEEQLAVLRSRRRPLPLSQFVEELVTGTLARDAVAVTFDDGYVDNLDAGLPRLEAADVPATVFLATGFIDRCEPFWWDELARLILHEKASDSFAFEVHGHLIHIDLRQEPPSPDSDNASGPSADRRAMLEALYEPLRHLDDDERRTKLAQLRSFFSTHDNSSALGRAMTCDEIRTLTDGGLVTIAAHTVTHPSLPGLKDAALDREAADSKTACEMLAAAPVTAFAYPYGEFNAQVREAVKRAGFTVACTSRRGPAADASDLLALPRIYIPDLGGDEFEQRLRWASELG
jgi:peptidoglycan/xylan/chitin deacetylase (PgdA/CDA1 family)